ncbi:MULTISPECIES: YwhD family protein [Oceanobacillus]|uniref:YwhD family protein n=1 Tax=Oceanobacillus jordanicus TaxID=2867266 RepID=A0AAW5B1N3_9BACI|nr:YwhD family protein [Oceanobacillus jordanicus]MCG3417898.1 YwhD family protein [Oceanobacillus jordanicus]
MSSDNSSNKKKPNAFTIIKDDSTDGHGGYGAGTISLENMSPVIVDPNEKKAYVDMGAMHGRSDIERRVKFLPNKEEVPNGLLYWIVWVNVERNENGTYYAGVAGSEIRVDRPIKRAYKSMPEHVTHMDKSLKGKIILEHMDEESKKLLKDFLVEFDPEMWANSTDELKEVLSV